MTRMDDIHHPEGHDPVGSSASGSGRGRRFRRNAVAVGAAMGLTLGGLGIAAAQTASTDSSTTTTAPAAVPATPAAPAAPAAGTPATLPPADPGPGGPGRHGPDGPGGSGLPAAAKAIGISEADLSTALRSGQSIAQVAQSKNVDPTTVISAMVADAKAKAEERAATLEQRITDAVNQTGGPGRGGPDHRGPGQGLAAAAKAIGVSEADLSTALRSGQSIAQVAQSKNVDVKVVIAAMVDEAKARLAADVQAGRLTQAQADEKAANLEQRITDAVNHTGGSGGPGGPGGPGRHGPGGP